MSDQTSAAAPPPAGSPQLCLNERGRWRGARRRRDRHSSLRPAAAARSADAAAAAVWSQSVTSSCCSVGPVVSRWLASGVGPRRRAVCSARRVPGRPMSNEHRICLYTATARGANTPPRAAAAPPPRRRRRRPPGLLVGERRGRGLEAAD